MTDTETPTVLSPETVKVGDGVTFGLGADRYPGTVHTVSASGKTITFTLDDISMAEGGDYYGHQIWNCETVEPYSQTDADGWTQTNIKTARWSAKRNRGEGGFVYASRTLFAGRRPNRDPSF